LFIEVIRITDCSVLCGHRNEADQNAAFEQGLSKLQFPLSKHNSLPSLAVDAVPYPINWNDTEAFQRFASIVLTTAKRLNIPIRWGGDWNQNGSSADERFLDMPHFELSRA
jgi:peptidoglycan LD-endopeptidase CwlK